jgi:tetratricopeptide (TPR) repeat protein
LDPPSASAPQPTADDLLKEEVDVVRQLVKDFPNETLAFAAMGNAYMWRGNSAEAAKCWEKCLELNPKFALAYTRLGMNALKKANYEEAVRLWRRAAGIDPAMNGVHGGLGRALLYLGKPQEAVVELEHAVRLSPQQGLEHFFLGQAYLQLNNCEKARTNFEKATQLQPRQSRAYYGLATVCEQMGESNKAKEYHESFRRLKAEESTASYREMSEYDDMASLRDRVVLAHATAGRLYCQSGGLVNAVEHYRRAVAFSPKNAVLIGELAALYERAGRAQDALNVRQRLQAIEPADTINLLNIGIGNARLGRFDAAETAYHKVIQLAPQQCEGYRQLATLYLKIGQRPREAKSLAETAVQLEPSAASFRILGEACDKNGDRQGALSAMERAIALEPNNDQYRQIYAVLKKGN